MFLTDTFELTTGSIVLIAIIAVAILCLILIATSLKIVPQAEAYVVEKLGAYHRTLHSGVHWVWPIFFSVAQKISLKEQVKDFDPQAVITMDNVTMQIDTVVFFEITDPKLYTYGVENPIYALDKLTSTTLRNIIGSIELDQTLTSRDLINTKMTEILDVATDPWGIKVTRVELKNILPPKDIREAMEKQMRAERERREAILQAEGFKQSKILEAEGIKQSRILEAEAIKQSKILEAEAIKHAEILQAEGQAESIMKVKQAEAEGIRLIREAKADSSVLTLKAYEALTEVSKGQATKIIIPSEIQGMAGLVSSIKAVAEEEKK